MQQHYLPREGYLKFFEIPDKPGYIYFYQRGKSIVLANTRNVAKEKNLYSFTDNDGKLNHQVEMGLGEFEGQVKPLLAKLNEAQEDFEITVQERNKLLSFVSLQAARTPTFKEMLKQIVADLGKLQLQAYASSKEMFETHLKNVRAAGFSEDTDDFDADELRQFVLDDTQYTVEAKGDFFLKQQFKLQDIIFRAIIPKRLLLLRCNTEFFITSDHPVLRLRNSNIPRIFSGGFRFSDILLPIGRNSCLVLGTDYDPETNISEDQHFMIATSHISAKETRQINKMTIHHAEKYLFSNMLNEKINAIFARTSIPTRSEFYNPFSRLRNKSVS